MHLTLVGVLSAAAATAVLIDAPRPVQICAVLSSTAANIITILQAELAIKQNRRQGKQ
jgi:hypothetical protein